MVVLRTYENWREQMNTRTQQSKEALQHANEVRENRNRLKREIKDGTVTIHSVLHHPPYFMRNMKIIELLTSQKRYGRTRALQVLRKVKVSESRPIKHLTERERHAISDILWDKHIHRMVKTSTHRSK